MASRWFVRQRIRFSSVASLVIGLDIENYNLTQHTTQKFLCSTVAYGPGPKDEISKLKVDSTGMTKNL
jgi:hypothetical protein